MVEDRCVESAGSINLFAELEGATAGGSWEIVSGINPGDETADLLAGTFLATGQPAGDYVFRYRAPDGFGCAGGTAKVTVRLVEIEVSGNVLPPDCTEECTGTITVGDAQPTWSYALDEDIPGGAVSFTGLCPGTYGLVAEDDRGCTARTELTVPNVTIPELVLRGHLQLMLGDSSRLEVLSNVPLDSLVWSPAVNCLDPECRTVMVRPLESTDYTVRAVSTFGCEAVLSATVLVDERVSVYVPTAFSPNGDGRNDRLSVFAGPAIEAVRQFRLFDRWGGRVVAFDDVALNDPEFGWDGRAPDGRNLTAGVYVWQLTVVRVDGEEELLTGEVTLMR